MTANINHYWSGTARPAEKVGPKRWRAEVWLCRRDTGDIVEKLEGLGSTQVSAMANGLEAAKSKAAFRTPKNWKGTSPPPPA